MPDRAGPRPRSDTLRPMRAFLRPRASLPALLLALLAAGCAETRAARPDVLLISVDTLRPDRLACYGGDERVGAALCDLARTGTRFVWAFAAAPATAPSIASLLTSQYPSEHGVSEFARTTLAEEAVSVAELLRDAGYATAAFVSNPVLDRRRRFDQGFDVYDQEMTRSERNRPGFREREAAATTRAALAWARSAPRPWFLWVHFQDPHGPYEPPGAARRRDPEGGQPLPRLDDHSGYGGIPAYQVLPGLSTVEAYEQRYVDEIRYLDVHLGLLVAGLDALGAPPFVALTADHAEAFGEDGYYFAHGHSLGLDQIRVPLLVRPTTLSEARVSTLPVTTLDVAPTLLAAAGVPLPPGLRGRPLPLRLGEEAAAEPRSFFAEHRLRQAVVVGRSYYASDRAGLDAPRADRISGGALRPLPPRTARLGEEGEPAPYVRARAEIARAFEAELARLPRLAGATAPAGDETLDAATREALRALGYLE